MQRFLFSLLFIASFITAGAQNFRGQWKGFFIDKSVSAFSWGGDRCDYVVDIDVDGKEVTGYTYTYFTEGGQKYYTICTIKGTADKKAKTISFTEISRTKTNVPDNITNSFQIHTLKWRSEGGDEILEGKWEPAPGQRGATGFGVTTLKKRQLTEISPLAKKVNAKKDPNSSPEKPLVASTNTTKKTPVKKAPIVSALRPPTVSKPVVKAPAKNTPAVAKTPVKTAPPVAKVTKPAEPVLKPDPGVIKTKTDTVPAPIVVKKATTAENVPPPGFEKRSNTLQQTVVVEKPTVKIELYDNGEIDGDSVSIFYNGKVLLAHKRLSYQPITLEIPISADEENELVMYADNLGTIPPNTALMIVTDGTKRYEVRLTSDLKKSGAIRFIHKNSSSASAP